MIIWRRRIMQKIRPIDWIFLSAIFIFLLYQGARLTWAAISAVPNNLVYQGHLTTAGGTPISVGNYDVKFEFYDAPTSGARLCDWTSTNVRVNTNGNFRAEIGDSASGSGSCTDIQTTIRENGALYLALSVKSGGGSFETLAPRIKIGGVARAHHAQSAVLAQNAVISDMVTTTTAAPASTDCDNSAEYGRLRVDSTNKYFYFCTSGGWIKGLPSGNSNSGSQIFNTLGNSTFTVPAGVSSITIKAWGGGGGGGAYATSLRYGRSGGGGAFAKSTLAVTTGQQFVVIVGGGGGGGISKGGGGSGGTGGSGLSGNGTGAGGNGGSGNGGGGGGGGSFFALSNGTIIVAAGGGGGGGGASSSTSIEGGYGGGGGAQGQSGLNEPGGSPGAQSSHDGATSSSGDGGGGGGGGGYTGGGSGSSSVGGTGGGGGSCAGDVVFFGSGPTPGNPADPERGTAGQGGDYSMNGRPGNLGKVIISW